jgi:hypothetical protein
MVEADSLGEKPVRALLVVAANADQKRPIVALTLKDGPGDIVTTQLGHIDIKKHGVGVEVPDLPEDINPLVSSAHLMAFMPKDHHERYDGVAIIVGNDDA